MNSSRWIVVAALLGASGVLLGATGAHLLRARLENTGVGAEEIAEQTEVFDTGVRYQMYHALALCGIGLMARAGNRQSLNVAGTAMVFGVAAFSGCLYAYVLTGIRPLVHVVPLGGVAFIVGWLALAVAAWRDDSFDSVTSHVG